MKRLFPIILVSCGTHPGPIEVNEAPDAKGPRAEVTRAKVKDYYQEFKSACERRQNNRCLFQLQAIDAVRVVGNIEGPTIEGRFTDYGHGIRSIQILDKDWRTDQHLKHTVWHEMGHAIGFGHDSPNLLMRSDSLTAAERTKLNDALEELVKDKSFGRLVGGLDL